MKHLLWLAFGLAALPALATEAATARASTAATPADDADMGAGKAASGRRTPAPRASLRYGVDDLLVEAGALPDAPETDAALALRASAFVLWQPDRQWEFRLGARVDGASQHGDPAAFTQWSADYTDTYARWRSGDTRLTLGAQTVIWGRADAVPVIDRVSRVDLTRFVLDDLRDRRRAQWALRWEQTWDDFKLDTVVLPWMRGAKLPEIESVWSPVNQTTGAIIGIAPTPQLSDFVRAARIDEDDGGGGGAGVRLTRPGEPFDFGVTLARTRQSAPYYLASLDPANPTLTAIHPYQNFAGVDAEWATGAFTWRTELGYTSDVPVTLPTAAMTMTDAVEWIGGVEFFPGGKDTRATLQLLARSLRTSSDILELKTYAGLNGEIESSFDQGRWRAALRFAIGLNVNDVYVNPVIRYVGWEPVELYAAVHLFNGEARTPGGFHKQHDLIAVGLRTRF
jgi:hypothetical protein